MGQEGEIQALPPRSLPVMHCCQCYPEFSCRPASNSTLLGKPFLFFANAIAYFDVDKSLLVRRNKDPVKLVYIKGKDRIFYKVTEISQILARPASWALVLLRGASLGDGVFLSVSASLCRWGSLSTILPFSSLLPDLGSLLP